MSFNFDCETDPSNLLRSMRDGVKSIPPLIKWTGSKRPLAAQIAKLIPPYRRYIEPFVGGGALLYLAGHPGAIAGDCYRPLIELWSRIRDTPNDVVARYADDWQRLQADFPAYYYQARSRFNADPNPLDLNFLMRTCVNGIVRFNASGEFNNSLHVTRRGMTPARFEAIVKKWSRALGGIEFVCQDFALTAASAERGDFVYFDPPYLGTRQRYAAAFDAGRLWGVLEELDRREVLWGLSLDGRRGETIYDHAPPDTLYRRRVVLRGGLSSVARVLNGPLEQVEELLYLNYD